MSAVRQTASPPPPEVVIANMSKRFGSLVALEDVSIRFEPGAFHALLGENGAGKSTLVKCVMGYYHADAGSISVDGRERRIGNPRHAHRLGLWDVPPGSGQCSPPSLRAGSVPRTRQPMCKAVGSVPSWHCRNG